MTRKRNILIVDDDTTTRDTLCDVVKKMGHNPIPSDSGAAALQILYNKRIDLVLSDVVMPKLSGIELTEKIGRHDPSLPVVLISGYANFPDAVKAAKIGAFNYIAKPLNLDQLRTMVEKAIQHRDMLLENASLQNQLNEINLFSEMIGNSPEIKLIFETIKNVARSDAAVLILGESGTGKELVANAIHRLSPRSKNELIKINSAALPRELLESELFGHEKGAFTGAIKTKKGKFELADTGTLFLDEIGDMAPEIQAKLLRVLEQKSFERVGGTSPISVDVRLITATHTDLEKSVESGKFREDLYYRINVVSIKLPPLRERPGDVALLADHFLEQFSKKQGIRRKTLSPDAMEVLSNFVWPGNIRQLRNVIERLMIVIPGETIYIRDLPDEFTRSMRSVPASAVVTDGTQTIDEIESKAIANTLKKFGGNKSKAAKVLGIGLKTLYRKIERYNIPDMKNNK